MNVMEAVVNYIANLPQLTNTTWHGKSIAVGLDAITQYECEVLRKYKCFGIERPLSVKHTYSSL